MNAGLRSVEKALDKIVSDRLLSEGFRKEFRDIYLKKVSDDTDFLLIIEKSDRKTDDTIFINPVVGVADNFVEKIYRDLARDCEKPKELADTAVVSIGYLMPGKSYRTWSFSVNSNEHELQAIVDDMLSSVYLYGVAYIDTLVKEKKLTEALQNSPLGIQKLNYFKIPLLYYKEGMKAEGLKFAESVLEQQRPTPRDPSAAEPHFSSYEEALGFFRRDKDVRFYYCYSAFIDKYKKLEGKV